MLPRYLSNKHIAPVKRFALREGLKLHELSRSSLDSWQLPKLPNNNITYVFLNIFSLVSDFDLY
jgi:hypothetical protein